MGEDLGQDGSCLGKDDDEEGVMGVGGTDREPDACGGWSCNCIRRSTMTLALRIETP